MHVCTYVSTYVRVKKIGELCHTEAIKGKDRFAYWKSFIWQKIPLSQKSNKLDEGICNTSDKNTNFVLLTVSLKVCYLTFNPRLRNILTYMVLYTHIHTLSRLC